MSLRVVSSNPYDDFSTAAQELALAEARRATALAKLVLVVGTDDQGQIPSAIIDLWAKNAEAVVARNACVRAQDVARDAFSELLAAHEARHG